MIRTAAMTNDELFEARCKRLKAASDKRRLSTWELVDELIEAEADLGDRFSQAVEVTMLTPEAIDNYMRTGRAWPADKRFLNMPFDYHTALNPLEPAQRIAALTMAQKADWDRVELRARIAAWKAGDTIAFDPRHKVAKVEKKARLSTQTPDDDFHAGVEDLNSSKEEAPVMDGTGVGAALNAEAKSEERREVLAGLRDQSLSSANQRLLAIMAELKSMRSDAGFLAQIEPAGINATALATEAQWLVNVSSEIRHRQNKEWER